MPKHLAALFLAALALPAAARDDPEPPSAVKPREIEFQDKRGGKARAFDAPLRIKNAKELAELVPGEEARAAILKKVDLKKEHLLLFTWAGSGGDRISLTENRGKEKVVLFEYTPGRTDDLARHTKLFAVPAKAEFKVTRNRGR